MRSSFFFYWSILIIIAALVLTVLNLYRLIQKTELIDIKYELATSFIQSSYFIYYVILIVLSFLFNNSKTLRTILINFIGPILLSTLFIIMTPFGLTLTNYFVNSNLTVVEEDVLSGINLLSIVTTTYFSITLIRLMV